MFTRQKIKLVSIIGEIIVRIPQTESEGNSADKILLVQSTGVD